MENMINTNFPTLLKYLNSTISNIKNNMELTINMENGMGEVCNITIFAQPIRKSTISETVQIGNKRYFNASVNYLVGYDVVIKKNDDDDIVHFDIDVNNMCMLTLKTRDENTHSVITIRDIMQYIHKSLDIDNIDPEITCIMDEFIKNLQDRTHLIATLTSMHMVE